MGGTGALDNNFELKGIDGKYGSGGGGSVTGTDQVGIGGDGLLLLEW